jgi:transcriptional regulator with XRE-family HTH domain
MSRRIFSGPRTRDNRLKRGLRVEPVAITVGRSAYSIHEYERGRVVPSLAVLAALADLYDCSVDSFFEEVADDAA